MEEHTSRITALLKKHPEGLSILEISAEIGLNRNSVARYLDLLESDGAVHSRAIGPARLYTIGGMSKSHELELYKRAMDHASCGIVIADAQAPDLPLIYANKAFLDLTGYSTHEVIGRNCRFLQGKGTEPAVLAKIRAALKAQQPVTAVLTNYCKDGTVFKNELRLAPVKDKQGVVTHYVGVQTRV